MRITKRQLLQIIKEEKSRLFEQEEIDAPEEEEEAAEGTKSSSVTTGVEDASQTADSFGGGEVEEEIFVDAITDKVLNQLADETGMVPESEVKVERIQLKGRLRKLVREAAGSGLPPVDDLAKKMSAAGAEEAMSYIKRLLDKVSFGAAEIEVEEPALPPALPPVDDMVPPEEV